MKPRRQRTAPWILSLALLATACVSKGRTEYTHPQADLGAIRTVAVLPFHTLTQNKNDAQKVEKIFLIELLALGVVEVVEPGEVAKLWAAERIESIEVLAPADLQRIGKTLAADALFLGTVVDFDLSRVGSLPAPEVVIQLRLVETASGKTLWSSSETRSGTSARARLFGFGGDSLTEAARKLLHDELETLVE